MANPTGKNQYSGGRGGGKKKGAPKLKLSGARQAAVDKWGASLGGGASSTDKKRMREMRDNSAGDAKYKKTMAAAFKGAKKGKR